MSTVLAIRHIYFEDLGVWHNQLTKLGFKIKYCNAVLADFSRLKLADYALIVVLGAPIGANDEQNYPFINKELDFIAQCIAKHKPLIGVCLGAQFIARLLGAKVYPMSSKEIGLAALQLELNSNHNPLNCLIDVPVLHWHGDQFDLPANTIKLASSTKCANQAFTYANSILALQFHVEANLTKIEQWLVGHASELASSNISPHQLRLAALKYNQLTTQAGCQLLVNWLRQANLITNH